MTTSKKEEVDLKIKKMEDNLKKNGRQPQKKEEPINQNQPNWL